MDTAVRSTRAVTARELSRRMSSLLDEIESERCALVVIRYGRPSAMLVPFRESAERTTLPRITDLVPMLTTEEIEEEEPDVELSEDQTLAILSIAHCRFLHWKPGQLDLPASRLAVALTKLELGGLAERGPGGSWRLTRPGERVARRLDSES